MGTPRRSKEERSKPPVQEVERQRFLPVAPEGATSTHVRLSPDRQRLAHGCDEIDSFGIFVGNLREEGRRWVDLGSQQLDDLQWSPDGNLLSYVVGQGLPSGFERMVGWASETGEMNRVCGAAMAWTPKGKLVVADVRNREVVHVNPQTGRAKRLSELDDDGVIAFPPRIAVASDGKHIAFTCRRAADQLSELFVIQRGHKKVVTQLVTQVPGADVHVLPFWSPKGKSLGMQIVHRTLDKSALILMPHVRGEGIIVHDHERIDPPYTPAWSASGRHVACWLADEHGIRLDVFDSALRTRVLSLGGAIPIGYPRFDGARLVVDGGHSAEVVTLSRQA